MLSQPKTFSPFSHLVLVFVLLAIGIGTTGYVYYRNEREAIKRTRHDDLSAIAHLKVNEISKWRKERLGDAEVIMNTPFIADTVNRWFTVEAKLELEQTILVWMKSLSKHYDYRSILLLDSQGLLRLTVSKQHEPVGTHAETLAAEALRTGKVVLSDLYRREDVNDIHIDLCVPLLIQRGRDMQPVGVLVLRIDPHEFLYSLIQSWPTPSPTAETLLVRREGDDVLFLNDVRHQHNTALTLRVSLKEDKIPAARAARGEVGVFEGVDYRGVPVLASIIRIPASPWYLIAKVDIDEIYAPIRERFWLVTIIVGLLIASAGAGIGFVWRHERARFYRKAHDESERVIMERTSELADANRRLEAEIVEHKIAEEHVKLYEEVFKYMPLGLYVFLHLGNADETRALKLIAANPSAVRFMVALTGDIIGKTPGDTFPFTHETEITQVAAEVLRSGETRELGELRYGGAGVSEGFVSVKAFPLPNNCVGVILEDITSRKEAERALRDKEELLRAVLETLPVGVWITDEKGTVTHGNRAALEIWAGARYIGIEQYGEYKGWWVETGKPIEPGEWAAARAITKGETTINEEVEIECFDGTRKIILNSAVPIRNVLKEITGAVVVNQDITARKRTEEALKESEGRFRKLSQQFHTLLEAITDPLTLLSPDLRVQWWNEAAGRTSGKKLSAPAGQYCYSLWHNRSTPCEGCPAAKSFMTGREEAFQTESPNGKLWELKAFPVRDERGGVINVLTVASDITEKMTLQAEALRAAHLASLGELAAGVAHEINNPINGIINYAQILSDEAREAGRESDIPTRIIGEGNRIASIVRSLLSFARERKEEKGAANVQDLLCEALDLVGTQLRKDGIILRVDMPRDLPPIMAHSQQIEQVFLNIINNARYALNQKYPGTDKEKILEVLAGEVTIDGCPSVEISFHDHGPGIPAGIREKVIDPFFTTKPRGVGTGLGLSISHGIISDHGGKVTIESVEGEFTKIRIVLPAGER